MLAAFAQRRFEGGHSGAGAGGDDQLRGRIEGDADEVAGRERPGGLDRAKHAEFGAATLDEKRLALCGGVDDGGNDAGFVGRRVRHAVSSNGNTLLGLSSQSGSQADLMRRCWSSSVGVN